MNVFFIYFLILLSIIGCHSSQESHSLSDPNSSKMTPENEEILKALLAESEQANHVKNGVIIASAVAATIGGIVLAQNWKAAAETFDDAADAIESTKYSLADHQKKLRNQDEIAEILKKDFVIADGLNGNRRTKFRGARLSTHGDKEIIHVKLSDGTRVSILNKNQAKNLDADVKDVTKSADYWVVNDKGQLIGDVVREQDRFVVRGDNDEIIYTVNDKVLADRLSGANIRKNPNAPIDPNFDQKVADEVAHAVDATFGGKSPGLKRALQEEAKVTHNLQAEQMVSFAISLLHTALDKGNKLVKNLPGTPSP